MTDEEYGMLTQAAAQSFLAAVSRPGVHEADNLSLALQMVCGAVVLGRPSDEGRAVYAVGMAGAIASMLANSMDCDHEACALTILEGVAAMALAMWANTGEVRARGGVVPHYATAPEGKAH